MSSRSTRLSIAVAAVAIAIATLATTARAETPPIRPGLWEMAPDGADAARMAKARESIEKMPPEARAKMEAMMKANGVDMGHGALRFCISKDSMNTDAWTNQGHCKTQFTTRSSRLWKWHSVCDQPAATEIDGEAVFASTESYTATVTSKSPSGTRTHSMKMFWKGGDCGDIKPVNTKR